VWSSEQNFSPDTSLASEKTRLLYNTQRQRLRPPSARMICTACFGVQPVASKAPRPRRGPTARWIASVAFPRPRARCGPPTLHFMRQPLCRRAGSPCTMVALSVDA